MGPSPEHPGLKSETWATHLEPGVRSLLGVGRDCGLVGSSAFAGNFFDIAALAQRQQRIFYQPLRPAPILNDGPHILPESRAKTLLGFHQLALLLQNR